MELFTLNRKFLRQDTIDAFNSAIWTERYYGDGEVELYVPATNEMLQKLREGTFLGLIGTDEIMILETQEVEAGVLKVSGNTLLKWLNNRFVRSSPYHQDRYWNIANRVPGDVLQAIVYYMCIGGPYLDGTAPIGVFNPAIFKIPGLSIGDYDKSGSIITVAVPFGPVYDAMKEIATTYQVGMTITLEEATDESYSLQFRSYRGLNRTSSQTDHQPVRFAPSMNSLTDIKELRSINGFKTLVYSYAPSNPEGLATTPGYSAYTDAGYTGFDLRALEVFCEDITTDLIGGSAATLLSILNARARDGLANNHFVKVVDGEIVPGIQFKYGVDYSLGDIIELQGNSGAVQNARVTEYIRVQDDAGERAYPTVSVID